MNSKLSRFFLACLLCTLFSGAAFGQKGLKLGLIALPQTTWMLNSDDQAAPLDQFTYKTTFGMAAGPTFGYNFGENVGFRMNLLYSVQGQRYENKNSEGDWVEHTRRLHYLKAPIMVGFNTGGSYSKVMFSMYAGFQASMLTHARYYNDDQSYTPDETLYGNVTDYPSTYRQYSLIDYGPVADIGLDIKLTYNVQANLRIRGDYGLNDAERKNATYKLTEYGIPTSQPIYSQDRPATTNITGGIAVGLTYTIVTQ